MTDLLAPEIARSSADTWRDARPATGLAAGAGATGDAGAVPDRLDGPDRGLDPRLQPPGQAGPVERVRALRERHRLREQRARSFVAEAMGPRRGLPVASESAVRTFLTAD